MKTLKYTILAFLLGINFVSCTPDDIGIEDETLKTEVSFTKGGNVSFNENEE